MNNDSALKPSSRRGRVLVALVLGATLASLAYAGGPGCNTDYYSCPGPADPATCALPMSTSGPFPFRELDCDDFDADCAGRTSGCNMMTARDGTCTLQDCNADSVEGYCISFGSLGPSYPMYRMCEPNSSGEYEPCGPGAPVDMPTPLPPEGGIWK